MASAARLEYATAFSDSRSLSEFASDVVVGLSHPGQKELPSKYLYDEVGSALFDVICVLPEYGLSRAGMRILGRHAVEIVDRLPSPVIVAELGSGSGQKTRLAAGSACAPAARELLPDRYFGQRAVSLPAGAGTDG